MISVSIIGMGRVGGALAISLPKARYSIDRLVQRGDELQQICSDVVFITTQDSEIAAVAKELSENIANGSIVFHTSGSQSSAILEVLKPLGFRTGSFHPLVSISDPEFGPIRFQGAYFCVEGDHESVTIGEQIARDLGGRPFSIDTKFKTLYHASAVTACGHLVALFDAAVEMMTNVGLSSEDAKEILLPLVTSTVQNLAEQSTAAALTGTFARADIETFTRHLQALNEYVSDDLLEIYLLLGERSLELAAREGVSPERIDSLRTKVSIAKSKLKW